jgi:Ulp1 family protease
MKFNLVPSSTSGGLGSSSASAKSPSSPNAPKPRGVAIALPGDPKYRHNSSSQNVTSNQISVPLFDSDSKKERFGAALHSSYSSSSLHAPSQSTSVSSKISKAFPTSSNRSSSSSDLHASSSSFDRQQVPSGKDVGEQQQQRTEYLTISVAQASYCEKFLGPVTVSFLALQPGDKASKSNFFSHIIVTPNSNPQSSKSNAAGGDIFTKTSINATWEHFASMNGGKRELCIPASSVQLGVYAINKNAVAFFLRRSDICATYSAAACSDTLSFDYVPWNTNAFSSYRLEEPLWRFTLLPILFLQDITVPKDHTSVTSSCDIFEFKKFLLNKMLDVRHIAEHLIDISKKTAELQFQTLAINEGHQLGSEEKLVDRKFSMNLSTKPTEFKLISFYELVFQDGRFEEPLKLLFDVFQHNDGTSSSSSSLTSLNNPVKNTKFDISRHSKSFMKILSIADVMITYIANFVEAKKAGGRTGKAIADKLNEEQKRSTGSSSNPVFLHDKVDPIDRRRLSKSPSVDSEKPNPKRPKLQVDDAPVIQLPKLKSQNVLSQTKSSTRNQVASEKVVSRVEEDDIESISASQASTPLDQTEQPVEESSTVTEFFRNVPALKGAELEEVWFSYPKVAVTKDPLSGYEWPKELFLSSYAVSLDKNELKKTPVKTEAAMEIDRAPDECSEDEDDDIIAISKDEYHAMTSRAPVVAVSASAPPTSAAAPPTLASLPSFARPGRVRVCHLTGADVEKLRPGEFLNDAIIDFYLQYVNLRGIRSRQMRDKVHIFSSLFFLNLSNGMTSAKPMSTSTSAAAPSSSSSTRKQAHSGVSVSCSREEQAFQGWSAVQHWTTNVDLFSKDALVVPINLNLHWSLAVVCNLPAFDAYLRDLDRAVRKARGLPPSPFDPEAATESNLPKKQECESESEHSSNNADNLSVASDIADSVPPSTLHLDPSVLADLERGDYSALLPKKTKDPWTKAPCIFRMDSLHTHSRLKVGHSLRAYLQYEWVHKKNGGLPLGGGLARTPATKVAPFLVPVDALTDVPLQVPAQDNSCDCGVFVCLYADKMLQFLDTTKSSLNSTDSSSGIVSVSSSTKSIRAIEQATIEIDANGTSTTSSQSGKVPLSLSTPNQLDGLRFCHVMAKCKPHITPKWFTQRAIRALRRRMYNLASEFKKNDHVLAALSIPVEEDLAGAYVEKKDQVSSLQILQQYANEIESALGSIEPKEICDATGCSSAQNVDIDHSVFNAGTRKKKKPVSLGGKQSGTMLSPLEKNDGGASLSSLIQSPYFSHS